MSAAQKKMEAHIRRLRLWKAQQSVVLAAIRWRKCDDGFCSTYDLTETLERAVDRYLKFKRRIK